MRHRWTKVNVLCRPRCPDVLGSAAVGESFTTVRQDGAVSHSEKDAPSSEVKQDAFEKDFSAWT